MFFSGEKTVTLADVGSGLNVVVILFSSNVFHDHKQTISNERIRAMTPNSQAAKQPAAKTCTRPEERSRPLAGNICA